MPFRLALRKYWWLLRRIFVDPLASLMLLGYDREEEGRGGRRPWAHSRSARS